MEAIVKEHFNKENNTKLTRPTINIIGAGLVGKLIGKLLTINQYGNIQCILNRTLESSQMAVGYIGQGKPIADVKSLLPAEITFITTPEDQINPICKTLLEEKCLQRNSILVHCSGSENLDVLQDALLGGYHIAKVHPIKHIQNINEAINSFSGTYCVIESDEESYYLLNSLFTHIGAKVIRIKIQQDYLYHTACVFGSVFPQILASATSILFENCGMEKTLALNLAMNLSKSALNSLDIKKEYSDFIEGPIKRMDRELLVKNVNSIYDPLIKSMYRVLTEFGINLSKHHDESKSLLMELISQGATVDD